MAKANLVGKRALELKVNRQVSKSLVNYWPENGEHKKAIQELKNEMVQMKADLAKNDASLQKKIEPNEADFYLEKNQTEREISQLKARNDNLTRENESKSCFFLKKLSEIFV
jgi:hypothetical protein